MDFSYGVVDGGRTALGFAFAEAMAEGEVKQVEFLRWRGGFAEVVAKVKGGAAPEVFERGLGVGEGVGAFGEEGDGAAGMEDDADELGEIDGVDVLMARVEPEEERGG